MDSDGSKEEILHTHIRTEKVLEISIKLVQQHRG